MSFESNISCGAVSAEEQISSFEESFHKITTSEAESFCSSDEEDAERLSLVSEGAFAGSPAKAFK